MGGLPVVWQFRSGNSKSAGQLDLGARQVRQEGGAGVADAAEATVSQSALGSRWGRWAWNPRGRRGV